MHEAVMPLKVTGDEDTTQGILVRSSMIRQLLLITNASLFPFIQRFPKELFQLIKQYGKLFLL